jgi:TolA-binding protein
MRRSILLLLVTAGPAVFAGPALGASKEELQMLRDIAQLQDQLRSFQSSIDQRMAAVLTLTQQAFDSAARSDASVTALNRSVASTLERELRQALTPVAGLAAKVDNTNNDVSELRSGMHDLTASINRVQENLKDLSNAVKVLQVPAAAAPPQASATELYRSAERDENGGNFDLAISEYQDFLRLYPDDPNASQAQNNLCRVYVTAKRTPLPAACDKSRRGGSAVPPNRRQ